jgi:hypothetical protein
MNNRIKQIFSATAFLMMVTQLSAQTIISPPAGNMPTEIHKDGKTYWCLYYPGGWYCN